METIKHASLVEALSALQAEVENPKRTKSGQQGNRTFKYATLDDMLNMYRPLWTKHGIAVVQLVNGEALNTRVMFDEQFIDSSYPLPKGLGSQDFGKAITFARRYTLAAILQVAAEEDTDGEPQHDDAEIEKKHKDRMENFEKAKKEGRIKYVEPVKEHDPADPDAREPDPIQPAEDDLPMGVMPELAKLMKADSIDAAKLQTYYEKRNLAKGSIDKLPSGFQTQIVKNWEKVKSAISKESK